jgi:alkylation response protein AidB-like acyl-CoA dehydrogenase
MANFYKDNQDLQFYMERGIDWSSLVEITEYFYRAPDCFPDANEALEFYQEIISLVGSFSAEEISPHSAQIDKEGVDFSNGEARFPERLQGIFDKLASLELHGMCVPRELGGQNCPLTLFYLCNELIARSDISVMTHNSFHGGIAMALLMYSFNEGTTEFDPELAKITKTRFSDVIADIQSGAAWGSMDITEPNAGSDMSALATRGEQDEEGNWFITGQKIFITSGHGKYHLVIARTNKAAGGEDLAQGLKGLSMFLVRAFSDDDDSERLVTIDRLEEKLGHHASATATVNFDRAPADLIGEPGDGFKYMLILMNNARIGVSFESLGLSENALRLAKEYASERRSMGKTIDRHEMIADYLDEMQSDIEGIRALAVNCAVSEELSQKMNMLLTSNFLRDEDRLSEQQATYVQMRDRSRRLTPLLKYIAAEKAVEHAQRCVQIHGGVGYTKEYGAEKLLRDAMVLPIYEGTSQIQSLMAMKDVLGNAIKNPGQFAKQLAAAKWRETSARSPLERSVAKVQNLSMSAQRHLITKTAVDKARALKGVPMSKWPSRFTKDWDPKRDFSYAMLHAERLTRIMVDEAICEILWEQAKCHPEREVVLARYLERALPRARYLHEQITQSGQRLLDGLNQHESESEVMEAV